MGGRWERVGGGTACGNHVPIYSELSQRRKLRLRQDRAVGGTSLKPQSQVPGPAAGSSPDHATRPRLPFSGTRPVCFPSTLSGHHSLSAGRLHGKRHSLL